MSGLPAAAGFWMLAATAAAVEPGRFAFSAPGRSVVLEAGSTVEVAWTAPPAGVEEVELFLSLDGGRRIALRLTERLSGASRSYSWRVPNLSARRACLVLRMGIEGREIESEPSPAFQIVPDRARSGEPLILRQGEIWLGGGQESFKENALPRAGIDSRESRWTSDPDRGETVDSSPGGFAGPNLVTSRPFRGARAKAAARAARSGEGPREPRPLPLRV